MQLLISVIDAGEAAAAMAGGTDILDIKNPAEGALGAPSPCTVREIRRAAPRPQPISVALGDMPDLPGTAALAALGAAACGADFVKLGLWGARTEGAAVKLLSEVRVGLAAYPGVAVIAAAYADAGRVNALDPACLARVACAAGVAGCLLDTAVKDGCTLFDFMGDAGLAALIRQAHVAGLLFALAGALRAEDLPRVRDLGADIVGVRSAACRDGRRSGPLEAERVARLRQLAGR